ncbi:MAG: DUF1641 domain-containing protein [Nitrososphaeria archaeon]
MEEKRNIVEKLSSPENAERIEKLIEALPTIEHAVTLLQELDRIGALDTLFSLACAAANTKNMLSDEIVSGAASLISTAIELLAKIGSPEVQRVLSVITDHSVELSQSMVNAERVKGLIGLIKALRDPEVQQGLGSLLAFLKVFGRYIKYENKGQV